MNIRIGFVGAIALFISASSASAQGQPQKQVIIPKTVLKTMIANKPKSKTQLGAKVGIRRSTVVTAKPANAAPTSVRQISPGLVRK